MFRWQIFLQPCGVAGSGHDSYAPWIGSVASHMVYLDMPKMVVFSIYHYVQAYGTSKEAFYKRRHGSDRNCMNVTVGAAWDGTPSSKNFLVSLPCYFAVDSNISF